MFHRRRCVHHAKRALRCLAFNGNTTCARHVLNSPTWTRFLMVCLTTVAPRTQRKYFWRSVDVRDLLRKRRLVLLGRPLLCISATAQLFWKRVHNRLTTDCELFMMFISLYLRTSGLEHHNNSPTLSFCKASHVGNRKKMSQSVNK